MASGKQTQAPKRDVKQAQRAAKGNRTSAHLSSSTKTALGKQGAAVAHRKQTGASTPMTRVELYELAKKRDLPGRSNMGRDELARTVLRRHCGSAHLVTVVGTSVGRSA